MRVFLNVDALVTLVTYILDPPKFDNFGTFGIVALLERLGCFKIKQSVSNQI